MAETTYIARRVCRDPADAAVAASAWHRDLRPVAGTRHVACAKRLWLRVDPESGGPDPLELYAVRGLLWVGARPVAVTLEVSMWSTTEIQVGLRPRRLWWPVRTAGFARNASKALDQIESVLSGLAVLRLGLGQAAPSVASPRERVPSAA
jgi:hypothetical protein